MDTLPDAVACLVLSKLRNAQAVAQCAAVCRRWRVLCQSVDNLSFESFKLFVDRPAKASCLESIVSQMLLNTTGVRELNICYHPVVWPWIPDDHFPEEKVCLWLQHVEATLEKLVLVDPNRAKPQPKKFMQLFRCKRLGWLNLCYGMITEMPPNLGRMDSLKTCVLDLIVINDGVLEKFVELCPLLEDLKVNSCRGLRAPKLVAPKLVSLEFVNEMDVCETTIASLSLNAPKLARMFLSYVEEVVTDGEALLELGLMCHVRPKIRDLSYLTALQMKGEVWHLESILQLVRLSVSVEQLHVDAVIEKKTPIQLTIFFQHLPLLKKLFIGLDMFECMQAGTDVGLITSKERERMQLPMLEEITAVVCNGNKACIAVLETLLSCSTSLHTLKINAQQLSKGVGNVMFFTDVLQLQRHFPSVNMSLDFPQSLL